MHEVPTDSAPSVAGTCRPPLKRPERWVGGGWPAEAAQWIRQRAGHRAQGVRVPAAAPAAAAAAGLQEERLDIPAHVLDRL